MTRFPHTSRRPSNSTIANRPSKCNQKSLLAVQRARTKCFNCVVTIAQSPGGRTRIRGMVGLALQPPLPVLEFISRIGRWWRAKRQGVSPARYREGVIRQGSEDYGRDPVKSDIPELESPSLSKVSQTDLIDWVSTFSGEPLAIKQHTTLLLKETSLRKIEYKSRAYHLTSATRNFVQIDPMGSLAVDQRPNSSLTHR